YHMKPVEHYRGREQTYLKHFLLENYLERVAYHIGYYQPQFVYVDGFSGPWRASDEATFEDTSFMIAIKKLQEVHRGLSESGKKPKVRCLFVERDPQSFQALSKAIDGIGGPVEVRAINAAFEEAIPTIMEFVGSAFALTFIDPTGW